MMADLIDRGKLLEYIDDNFYPTTVSCYMTVAEARVARERHNMFIDAINNAQAVDAVPVCWLEAKRENLFLDALVNGKVYGNTSIDDIHCINRVLEICGKKDGDENG